MMKFHLSEQAKEAIKVYSISGMIIAAVCFILRYIGSIGGFVGKLLDTLSPFFLGFGIAFVLLPLRRIVENKWLARANMQERTKRKVAVAGSVSILLLVISGFFMILIPQLVSSFQTFVNSFEGYMDRMEKLISLVTGEETNSVIISAVNSIEAWLRDITIGSNGVVVKVVNYSVSVVNAVFNFFIGVIVAVYLMMDQEKFVRQVHRLIYATHSPARAEWLFHVGRLTTEMFNSFIFGKALDSMIIGIICWICTSIMRIPYSPLISVLVGITNMIPVFGPFIGAVPSILILLFISPMKALEFALFILILQQVDGNILGPYILGDSMGLPAIWIMFAIIVGGSLFGVVGMFLGVPIFSVIYILVKDWMNRRIPEVN